MSRSVAQIDKSAFKNNIAFLGRLSHGAPILMMAKANAYGHGLKEMAALASDTPQIVAMGVACVQEAAVLRANNFKKPILLFDSGSWVDEEFVLADLAITPVITHRRELMALEKNLARLKCTTPVGVHVKIDTGFMRNGFHFRHLLNGDLDDVWAQLKSSELLKLDGVATHFCCADASENEFTPIQMERFSQCLRHLEKLALSPGIVHMANSPAILRGFSHLNGEQNQYPIWVRPGIALFGVDTLNRDHGDDLMPVLSLKSKIVSRKTLLEGEGIGYGHRFVASKEMPIALVAIGYGDGVRRSLSNIGHVLVHGMRVPIIGSISMDSLAIDLSSVVAKLGPDAAPLGSPVTLLGSDGEESISVLEWAQIDNTIPYEILTSIADRVARVIVG
jgi:alanine racemase